MWITFAGFRDVISLSPSLSLRYSSPQQSTVNCQKACQRRLRLPAQSSQELRLSQRCSRHTGNRLPSWKVPGINLLPDFSTETARRIGTQIAAIRRVGDVVIASRSEERRV